MKLDVYALGIILLDMVCNPATFMECMKIDQSIKSVPPQLPRGYQLEGTVEGDILLQLVQPDPVKRPKISEIRELWLPKWTA